MKKPTKNSQVSQSCKKSNFKRVSTTSLKFITRSAVIAALYFALSVAFEAIAFGPVQFRVSEVLVLLPVLMPEAIPGLAIGCFFTNFFFSPFGIFDMLFGTLATTLAALLTYFLRKHITLASLPPVIFNALLIPIIFILNDANSVYYIAMFEIMLSEFIICCLIGIPFTLILKKALISARLINISDKKFKHIPPYKRVVYNKKDKTDNQNFDIID